MVQGWQKVPKVPSLEKRYQKDQGWQYVPKCPRLAKGN